MLLKVFSFFHFLFQKVQLFKERSSGYVIINLWMITNMNDLKIKAIELKVYP